MPLVCYQRALGMAETTQLPADGGICSSTNSPPKLAGLQLFAAKLNLARLREPCGQYDSSAENGTKPMSYTAMPSITSPIRLAKWNRAVHLTEAKGSSIFQQYKSGLDSPGSNGATPVCHCRSSSNSAAPVCHCRSSTAARAVASRSAQPQNFQLTNLQLTKSCSCSLILQACRLYKSNSCAPSVALDMTHIKAPQVHFYVLHLCPAKFRFISVLVRCFHGLVITFAYTAYATACPNPAGSRSWSSQTQAA